MKTQNERSAMELFVDNFAGGGGGPLGRHRPRSFMSHKLGSLFDGSGGFPLAGSLCGIEPRWASEVEPYPIAVTRERFPDMKHLGDISKVHGAEIEPVDIITFGSPCQDLSVAGKRAGLKHEANGDDETTRSGLFMEAVRIIKEMREATNGEYPTFALWENVPGAFSSNKGEDFRLVCEELIKIVEPSASMPAVPKAGWAYADSYIGDGWSLAYRVFDAQYWGVPQRRRRIHLVVDFRGERAGEVLFEREGLRGYFAEGGTPWQAAPENAERCPDADDREGEGNGVDRGRGLDAVGADLYNGALTGDKAATVSANSCITATRNGPTVIERQGPLDVSPMLPAQLGTGSNNTPFVVEQTPFCKSARAKSADDATTWKDGKVANTLNTFDQGEARANEIVVMATQQGGAEVRTDDKAPTVTAAAGMSGNNQPVVCYPIHDQATRFSGKRGDKEDGKGNGLGIGQDGDPMNTLTSGDRYAVVYALDRASFDQGQNAQYDFEITDSGINSTIVAKGPSAVCYAVDQGGGKSGANVHENRAPTLCTTHGGEPAVAYAIGNGQVDGTGMHDQQAVMLVYGVDCRNAAECEELNGTLQAKSNGGFSLNCNQVVRINYIVRRLTPTECARLQGFADLWGHIEKKDTLTDEEYRFWMEVRNTQARINGKKEQDYTEKQMLTWYNKLWTDSAEYKMWGNGIALPPALYVMQGIIDALRSNRHRESQSARVLRSGGVR